MEAEEGGKKKKKLGTVVTSDEGSWSEGGIKVGDIFSLSMLFYSF